MLPTSKPSKFNAKKVEHDGITFPSKAEARRYLQLKLLVRAGEISELKIQPRFELVKGVKFTGDARAKPALRYTGDFSYIDKSGHYVLEDVKGMATEAYKIRRHLMLALLGIEVKEVRK